MKAAEPLVAAVDIGTSAVRAALLAGNGSLIRSVRRSRTSDLGGLIFDAEALWNDVKYTLRDLELRELAIDALAITAHIGTVAVDDELNPVVHAGSWADSRGLGLLNSYSDELLQEMLDASGRAVTSGGAASFSLDINAQQLGSRVQSLLSPKDFIVAKLTGVAATDFINAAYTSVSDIRTGGWQSGVLQQLGVPSSWFPKQVPPTSVVAEVMPDAALSCGLPTGVKVISGGPDGSVGLGLLLGDDRDAIADVAGTTDVLGKLSISADGHPEGALVNPSLVPGRWTVGGSTGLTGGAVANWRSLVGRVDEPDLAGLEPGVSGLRIVPAMSGERFPCWRSKSKGGVLGKTIDHGAAAILRAAQEAACFTVREGLDLIDPTKRLPINIAGGSVRSAAVAQMRANVFGRQLRVASDPDVTLLGAAGLALIAIGEASDLGEARDRLGIRFREIDPQRIATDSYEHVYRDWKIARDLLAVHDTGEN
ncbi:FGGY-family carbohydrate kinase [Brevibacterium sp. SMBL_HHYL_HB1]|uniref:xylulokinase n=1 Tax=Brevibacterium sp. SMBL_HHYL_HB1 TaxID=2777556 RepID=UPI001BA5FA04|nr:FGGY-family carbohydrate kinase [Brevibacterium sp. SMBL_HHYL_HB1]QUL78543.1 FGGY-family carbohydrate kinase [Brevibacterium sp. SMBL_HHYL_HB1]